MKKLIKGTGALALIFTAVACQSAAKNAATEKWEGVRGLAAEGDPRGTPAEYDPGPSKDSKWPDLFAETPNYRAYGEAVYDAASERFGVAKDRAEKFRWKVGPMWYRGRLQPESVKVFVIGQEGAQDENVSNRTFTGSTGTKMQNFINYFGIDRSYLFMNTFMYTITGQYGERAEPGDTAEIKKAKQARSNALFWLAQNPDSAIVKHRHRLFDYMLEQNKRTLSLMIGVGTAGKDSLATWIRSHGGNCTASQLGRSFCDASVIAPGAIAIGVRHPGGASARNGGDSAAQALRAEFSAKAKLVADRIQRNANWLKPDPGMRTDFSRAYFYKDAAIPHRDFAFGTNWRMGKDGTTSNRRGADGIQIYSDAGCYNNAVRLENGRCDFAQPPKTLNLKYFEPKDMDSKMDMSADDVPWESPKSMAGRRDFDEGPGEFAPLLAGVTQRWPDFKALGVTQHLSFGTNSIYRGNLKNPRVLILGDQESHDDLFSGRALTGTGGQRLQTFLNAIGAGRDYAIIRTLPVDTLDLTTEKATEIALNADVTRVRGAILDALIRQGKTKLILAVGPVAIKAMRAYGPSIPVVEMESPLSETHAGQWTAAAAEIARIGAGFQAGTYDGTLTAIPRGDFPVHTRFWMGTSGTRSSRAFLQRGTTGPKTWNGDYYQFNAPSWVSSRRYPADASQLSSAEKSTLNGFRSFEFPSMGASGE